MGNASITVKVDLSGIERKLSPMSIKKGHVAMISQAKIDMEPYIPRFDGLLRASGRPTDRGVEYDTPYARAQFYGSSYNKYRTFTFKHYSEPGTGKRWDLRVPKARKEEWGRAALRAMGVKP